MERSLDEALRKDFINNTESPSTDHSKFSVTDYVVQPTLSRVLRVVGPTGRPAYVSLVW